MADVLWKEIWKKRAWKISCPDFSAIKNLRQSQTLEKLKRMSKAKIFAKLSFFLFLSLIIFSFLIGILLVVLARSLPAPDRIVRREGFATKIFDRNGKLIYDVFENQKRTPVQLYEVPKYLKEATVSIEDKDFYSHKGFDPKGYLRAVYYMFVDRRRLQGGSTLTQQLVKNVLLSSERTVVRKIKEFVLALEIEAKYSKDQILQMYLNEAPYGGTVWGVEEASKLYFGKSVSELNLVESAILAGLPQRPSYYSPSGSNPKAYVERTKAVLRRLREDGKISLEDEEKAAAELDNVKFAGKNNILNAPHFVMYVKNILEDKYGEKSVELGGLRVTTTLDLDFHQKVQEIVSSEIAKVEKLNITNGAAIVMNAKTGEILSMVGSKNYDDPNYDGQFNVIAQGKRQPGSAIKPVTYVTALKKGYTASSFLVDTTTVFPGSATKPEYIPVNYDGKEHGPLQVRFALGNSINVAAVKMLSLVGLKEMLSTAFEMGIFSLEPTQKNLSRLGLSVTLGGGEVLPIELASAYCSFANGGLKIDPVAVLKVTDKDGNILEEFKPVEGKRVLSEEEAFIISDILSDNNARLLTFGENSLLKFSDRQVAVKTGTTNDKKDNWTIGWTPQVMVGVWVGNNDNSSMKQLVSGISGAAPIWKKVILEYLKGKEVINFPVPSGIVTQEADIVSGYKAHDGFPFRKEYYISGTEPTEDDPIHAKLKICKSQKKLATVVDIAKSEYDEKEFFVFKENDPFAKEGKENMWQKGIDDWIAKQSDERYHPPTEPCDNSSKIYVKFETPQDQVQTGSSFSVKITTVSLSEIAKVEIFVDNESKKILTSLPYELDMTLPDGKHTIKAIATDTDSNQGSQETRIGVNVPWDYNPSPTSLPTATPSPVPTLSPSPTL